MDFFIGGYYLVQGRQKANWMNKDLLPSKIWSVSSCICTIYPDYWIFNWRDKPPLESHSNLSYQKVLQLNDDQFKALKLWGDGLWDEKSKFGWPNVFLDIDAAREFNHQYLMHLSDIKLMSIALSEPYEAEFIEEAYLESNSPFPPMSHNLQDGVRKKLLQRKPVEENAIIRGFEILGDESVKFHSSVCHSLETDYNEQLNISINSYGLIDNYEEAVKATDYTRLDKTGAEPALWQPWLVSEYSL